MVVLKYTARSARKGCVDEKAPKMPTWLAPTSSVATTVRRALPGTTTDLLTGLPPSGVKV